MQEKLDKKRQSMEQIVKARAEQIAAKQAAKDAEAQAERDFIHKTQENDLRWKQTEEHNKADKKDKLLKIQEAQLSQIAAKQSKADELKQGKTLEQQQLELQREQEAQQVREYAASLLAKKVKPGAPVERTLKKLSLAWHARNVLVVFVNLFNYCTLLICSFSLYFTW